MQMNMNKVMIKLLQGSVATQTVFDGLTLYIFQLLMSYSVYVPKLWKLALDNCNNNIAYFFLGHPVYMDIVCLA